MVISHFKCLLTFATFASYLVSTSLLAQTSQFEVGVAALPATTTATSTTLSPFTRINFSAPFASGVTPNVFPMTPEFGAGAANDPCTIRIRMIDNAGFEAACLEPINEDRDSPAVSFNYIAMVNGTLNIPVVGSTDTVRFESRCSFVNSQVFGPNCDNCTLASGQSQSFTSQSFLSPAFDNPPALLTQIASVNNTIPGGGGRPGGEPEFLEASVQTNSLTATGFNWTLDRLEAGDGNLNNGETICYLAVERNGCQELDFSAINGPASVDFAAVFGGNVDGHDNGATAGEGATFPAGCFSSTPVTLAGSRSRRGNNGGILRLVSENTAAAIFTYDEDRVSDGERSHVDEEISAIAFSSTFTTPVTLSKALVTQLGRRTTFKWETSSETFHLGFHLWGETQSGWEQLNNKLILGSELDTAETNRYTQRIRLNRRQYNEVQRFGISTIDNTGFEQFYGPFELNTEYGEDTNAEPVDWSATRAAFEKNMLARGFTKINQRWRKVSKKRAQRLINRQLGADRPVLNLEFATNGIHSIPAQEVLSILPSWNGAALENLAITINGEAAPRDVISEDDRFSFDDSIIINVKQPEGSDSVYLSNHVYQLRLDRSRAQSASLFDGSVNDSTADSDNRLNSGMVSVTATSDKVYSAGIEADQPWYDRRLVSRGTPSTANYTVNFPHPINPNVDTILDFTIFGGINLGGDIDDHHAQISVNGTVVDDAVFDGLSRYSKRVTLPAGLVTQTNNIVSVTVVGDTGLFADLILIDDITLSAPEVLEQRDQYDFFITNTNASYQASLPNASSALVYAYTKQGLLSQVEASFTADTIRFSSFPNQQSLRSDLRVSISQNGDLPRPSAMHIADITLQHSDLGNLIIVTHPHFAGDDLNEFAEYKQQQGYQVSIVDWLDLVETYGYGNNTPKALDNFLAQAFPQGINKTEGIQNLLIVGGHTYDYHGNLDQDIVNFIPTHYRKVGIFDFTPSDNVYADLNNDQIPDLAIGRWPVRTLTDLSTIIKKTRDWQTNRDASPYQDALLISQPNDSSNLNFTQQMDRRLAIPLSRLEQVDTVSRIAMQELADEGLENPVQTARERIESHLNEGLELLSFGGHGGYVSWGFQGLVNTDFVRSLSNQGKPTLVMPLACYTSNYEHPSVNTLAHQWLFAGDAGAAGIHGAAVLGEYRENAVFAERYLNNLADSKTVGEAIFRAKNDMASGNQMLHNWAYLGDPTLPLR